ncbi:MAG: hypothetical protein KDD69_19160, partial [Bdellovibrionales bacterium]|nr:hypothetical protein [Bdellovibrionales bacterium]
MRHTSLQRYTVRGLLPCCALLVSLCLGFLEEPSIAQEYDFNTPKHDAENISDVVGERLNNIVRDRIKHGYDALETEGPTVGPKAGEVVDRDGRSRETFTLPSGEVLEEMPKRHPLLAAVNDGRHRPSDQNGIERTSKEDYTDKD